MAVDPIARRLRRRFYGGPYIEQLRALGDERREALETSKTVLRRVEELLPEALDVGLTISEIAELSAVSRPTLHKFQRESQQAR